MQPGALVGLERELLRGGRREIESRGDGIENVEGPLKKEKGGALNIDQLFNAADHDAHDIVHAPRGRGGQRQIIDRF